MYVTDIDMRAREQVKRDRLNYEDEKSGKLGKEWQVMDKGRKKERKREFASNACMERCMYRKSTENYNTAEARVRWKQNGQVKE